MVIRHSKSGKYYLYDIVNIKKRNVVTRLSNLLYGTEPHFLIDIINIILLYVKKKESQSVCDLFFLYYYLTEKKSISCYNLHVILYTFHLRIRHL